MLGHIAAGALALVFAAAALAKLVDRAGTRTAVVAFGVPERLAGPAGLLVPMAELAVAILLVAPGAHVAGGVGALVLLGVLSGAITLSLARGRAPECNCFGQLHSAPASWRTLVRNLVLAGLGVLTLTAPRFDPSATAILLAVAVAGVLAAFAGGTAAFIALTRSHGRLLLRLDAIEQGLAAAGIELEDVELAEPRPGLTPGTPAPAFTALDETGASVSLADLLAPALPLLVAFTSPDCGPCRALLPRLATWQQEHAGRLTVAMATEGDLVVAAAEAQAHGLERVLADDDLKLYGLFEASGTPSAVMIGPDATIASFVATGADAIEALVADALADAPEHEQQGLPLGAPAPTLQLRGLDGQDIALAGDDGLATLLLFWNPSCGFCGSMRDDLLAWERDPPAGAPRLVVVSSGEEDATRADGFAGVVALDPEMAAASKFGAAGTPMAVLVDEAGRIASPVAAGAAAVLELAGPREALSGRSAR
jgi:thiol-disulfide isomerase/thioredoxin